jgi:hypothetical protein
MTYPPLKHPRLLLATLLILSPNASHAQITLVDWVGFGSGTGSTSNTRTVSSGELGTFTANGADKLVVTIGGEGINNAAAGAGNSPKVLSLTYGGVALTKVFENYINNRGNSMWWLDNVAVTGDFVITYEGDSDDLGFAAYAMDGTLAGTAEDTGSVTGHGANLPTRVQLDVTTAGSFVVAALARNNYDNQNTSIPAPNTGVVAPLTSLFYTNNTGASTAAGYATNVAAGTFNAQIEELTNDAGSLIAASFKPAPATSSDFQVVITPTSGNSGSYGFQWASQAGKVYDLVSSTDLSTPRATWSVWNGQSDLVATPPNNILSNIPGGGDPRRFFAVVERDAPPLP